MNCPSCGAPMRLAPGSDTYRCDYCGNVFIPEKDDDGVRVLGESEGGEECGVCHLPLVEASLAKVRILYCNKCRGMLVPMGAFSELIDELRALQAGQAPQSSADREGLGRKINCPRCRKQMDTHFYAGPGNVIIDSCEDCAVIWLDRGEIMRISHAPDAAAGAY